MWGRCTQQCRNTTSSAPLVPRWWRVVRHRWRAALLPSVPQHDCSLHTPLGRRAIPTAAVSLNNSRNRSELSAMRMARIASGRMDGQTRSIREDTTLWAVRTLMRVICSALFEAIWPCSEIRYCCWRAWAHWRSLIRLAISTCSWDALSEESGDWAASSEQWAAQTVVVEYASVLSEVSHQLQIPLPLLLDRVCLQHKHISCPVKYHVKQQPTNTNSWCASG